MSDAGHKTPTCPEVEASGDSGTVLGHPAWASEPHTAQPGWHLACGPSHPESLCFPHQYTELRTLLRIPNLNLHLLHSLPLQWTKCTVGSLLLCVHASCAVSFRVSQGKASASHFLYFLLATPTSPWQVCSSGRHKARWKFKAEFLNSKTDHIRA